MIEILVSAGVAAAVCYFFVPHEAQVRVGEMAIPACAGIAVAFIVVFGLATAISPTVRSAVASFFGLNRIAVIRVESTPTVSPSKVLCIRLLESLGFQREGYLRERWLVGQEVNDAALYGLLRSEWQAT